MNRKAWIFIIIGVTSMLLGMKIGWDIHSPPKCPECPEIVPQTLTERDSSIQQPTVTNTVPAASITSTVVYEPVYRSIKDPDSGGASIREEKQAVNCWNFDVVEPDSARIAVHICSRSFAVEPPADLVPKIDYTASPQIRVIERTNNVIQPCPDPPKPKRWGMTVGPYVGYGVNVFGKQNIQVGIGLSWGYRIRAR